MTLNINIIASGSTGNCIEISDSETSLLLDAGIPIKKIREGVGFKLSEVSGALISHSHGDHSSGVHDLLKNAVNTYMSKDTAEAINVNSHRTKIVKPLTYTYIGSWTCLGFDLPHDVPNMGYMLQSKYGSKIVYLTDFMYCPYRFKNLTHILISCNYSQEYARSDNAVKYKRVLQSHASIETVKDFIKANWSPALEEVYLLHLSERNSDSAKFKKEIQKVAGCVVKVGGV